MMRSASATLVRSSLRGLGLTPRRQPTKALALLWLHALEIAHMNLEPMAWDARATHNASRHMRGTPSRTPVPPANCTACTAALPYHTNSNTVPLHCTAVPPYRTACTAPVVQQRAVVHVLLRVLHPTGQHPPQEPCALGRAPEEQLHRGRQQRGAHGRRLALKALRQGLQQVRRVLRYMDQRYIVQYIFLSGTGASTAICQQQNSSAAWFLKPRVHGPRGRSRRALGGDQAALENCVLQLLTLAGNTALPHHSQARTSHDQHIQHAHATFNPLPPRPHACLYCTYRQYRVYCFHCPKLNNLPPSPPPWIRPLPTPPPPTGMCCPNCPTTHTTAARASGCARASGGRSCSAPAS